MCKQRLPRSLNNVLTVIAKEFEQRAQGSPVTEETLHTGTGKELEQYAQGVPKDLTKVCDCRDCGVVIAAHGQPQQEPAEEGAVPGGEGHSGRGVCL